MKNKNPFAFLVTIIVAGLMLCSFTAFSQTDTLHLNYHHTQIVPHDSTSAKIDKWVKSLNGKHVDIEVLAYFHKSEFKQFATQRADELFLVLNRKARALITIDYYGARKGEHFQKTRVDIVYKPTVSEAEAKEKLAAAQKEKVEAAKAKEQKEAEEKAVAKAKREKQAEERASVSTKKKENKSKEQTAGKDGGAKAEGGNTEDKENNEAKNDYGYPKTKQAGAGALVRANDVKKVKSAKLIIAQVGDKDLDEALQAVVKDFWDFTSDITTMTYKEARAFAKEKAKTKENYVIMSVGRIVSQSLSRSGFATNLNGGSENMKYVYISVGKSVMIEDAKGNVLAFTAIPGFSDGEVGKPALAFGVSALNYLLKTMHEKNVSNNLKVRSVYKAQSEKLKLKTLYIPEFWLSEKLDGNKIAELYQSKSELVSYEKWSEAILTKKEDVAYVIIAPFPIAGDYQYIHYLMDAQTGMVYAMCAPKVGMKVGGLNVSKANTGYINKSNIKRYNDAIEGDW